MKIAMLGHKRIPTREGGIEIVVEELATRMVAAGHEVTCYNRRGHHVSNAEYDLADIHEYKGVRVKSVCTIDKKGLAAMTSSFFAALKCAFGKYDVVHFHAEGPSAMMWLPKLFGKRCIATVHGLDHMRAKWKGFSKKYILFGEKTAVKLADEIIVLSRNVEEYFKTTYGRKTVYIPNGVSRPAPRPAERITEKYGLSKDGYILFLGRIVPEKGLRYLVEAYRGVATDKKLVIAGGSSDTAAFMEELRASAESDPRIVFTGFVEGAPLEELYSNAYIYTLPSDLEGMPLSLLEAMSYGNCCVVSDIPECTEVVEDHAVVFERGNVSALRDALQALCDDPARVLAYKDGAADFITEKYNWDDVVDMTLKLYEGEKNV